MNIKTIDLKTLKEAGKKQFIRDDSVRYFGARCMGKTKVEFILRYASPDTGKDTIYVMGVFGKAQGQLSLPAARSEARSLVRDIENGIDPRVEQDQIKRQKKVKANAMCINRAERVHVLVDAWLADCEIRVSQGTMVSKRRTIKRIVDEFGDRNITSITQDEAVALLVKAEGTGKTLSTAGELLKQGSAFWNWGERTGRFDTRNIWSKIPDLRKIYNARKPKSFPSEGDLTELAESGLCEFNKSYRRAIIVMLFTCCRGGMATSSKKKRREYEQLGMDWSEIDLERRTWAVPAERMKSFKHGDDEERYEQLIPLSDQFYAHLMQWWHEDGGPTCGPITPSRVDPSRYVANGAFVQEFRRQGFSYTPHKFRVAIATGLSEKGCPNNVVDSLLYHSMPALHRIYNRNDFFKERKHWLQVWADHLDTLGFDKLATSTAA